MLRAVVWTAILVLLAGATPARSDGTDEGRRFSFDGDARLRVNGTDAEQRDGTSDDRWDLMIRLRGGLGARLADAFRIKARLAGSVSTIDNDYEIRFYASPPTTFGLLPGQVTADELYLAWKPGRRLELTVGRFQTLFQIKGVMPRTLDRKDSNNMRINWTDGAHLRIGSGSGWTTHLIAQLNPSHGPTSVRREPLDFEDRGSRVSYFLAVENERAWGPVVQRGIDVSYLPSSLLEDGTRDGPVVDYWGVLGRASLQWPPGAESTSFLVGAEVAYAPRTPTEAAMGTGAAGDAGGLAWQVAANVMNLKPKHSLGFNYGRVEAGWLLSPQFRNNDELVEARYLWTRSRGRFLEIRLRYRSEIDALTDAVRRLRVLDGFVRYTHAF